MKNSSPIIKDDQNSSRTVRGWIVSPSLSLNLILGKTSHTFLSEKISSVQNLQDSWSKSDDLGHFVEFCLGFGSLRRIESLLEQQRKTLSVHDGLRVETLRDVFESSLKKSWHHFYETNLTGTIDTECTRIKTRLFLFCLKQHRHIFNWSAGNKIHQHFVKFDCDTFEGIFKKDKFPAIPKLLYILCLFNVTDSATMLRRLVKMEKIYGLCAFLY